MERRHGGALARAAQACRGGSLRRAGREREDARRVDERSRAQRLEIERVLGEVADQSERRTYAQRGLGKRPQEGAVRLGLAQHAVTQLAGKARLAMDGTEVEEDAGVEQRLGIVVADPVVEHPPPLQAGEAPARVARHDVALAQRKAAGIQASVHLVGELEQLPLVAAVDEGVVLVGNEGLLPAAFASEREPAPAVRERATRGGQLD